MWKLYFSIWFWQKSTSKDLLLGTFWEQLNNVDRHFPSISNKYHHPFTFSVEMHSTFVMVNESFSVEGCSLQDEVRYTRPIFPFFFDSPFSSKGKRRKQGWRIEADDWYLRPNFSSFTANSLYRIVYDVDSKHPIGEAKPRLFSSSIVTTGNAQL